MMVNKFKKGDLVTSDGREGLTEGVTYKVLGYSKTGTIIAVTGGDLEKTAKAKERFREDRGEREYGAYYSWYLSDHTFTLATECGECIYECKALKKCSLFTMTPPPFKES